jgi:hypothetical protein
VLERPGRAALATGDREGTEHQVSVFARWQRAGRRTIGWFTVGAGWRRFRTAAPDTGLGEVTLRGVNVLHARGGVDWRIGARTLLGIAFDWTIGYYRSGRYDPALAAAYLDRTDRPPPAIDAGALGGGANIYSIGPRLSFVID